ncbi:MAG TPA: peptidylprolyl isomerase [Candidatus Moranbacteria bacterium]|nr:peptidylprolyl isomerase [Candidatus Moranbacteria bacterium]
MNKKILLSISIIFLAALLSGCVGSDVKKAAEQPIEDAANYVPEMVDINKKAHEDTNNAVNKENERLQNALNEGNVKGENDENNNLSKKYMEATLKTNLGDIKIKFDAKNAPNTVNNFLKLANEKFYDGTKFHRVIKSFMIQGGDPLSKDESKINMWGTGGPGYKFADELKGTEKYAQGTLAMANAGPNTNGSQFFIVTASPSYPLPPSYTVFGHVVSGMDTALKIENVQTGANDRPVENVIISSVELLEK